jgi:UDP-N-acetylmuramoyl-L-alanyl-D-glutamate--2,6-diaminopimelate ligase
MTLRELSIGLDHPVISGDLDTHITGITYDSRKVKPGVIFVALRGVKSDGHDFIGKALELEAAAIVAETAPPDNCRTPWLHVRNSRVALADLAAAMQNHPSQHMMVGAVTGTNGKTTTAFLLHHLLNHAQLRCGLLGTVVYDVGGELKNATHTTPESLELQALLSEMLTHGCRAVAMEASSHALEQHRMHGVKVDAAIFTNLTQDHLDYHGNMEAYFEAKAKLFEMVASTPEGHLIINGDDTWGRRLVSQYASHEGLVTYGLGTQMTYRAVNPRYDLKGTTFEMEHKGRSLLVQIPLIGQFNVYNTLAAIATAHSLGCNLRDTVKAMQSAPQVPGRMERVTERERFHVFVDYAHTPDGLVNALSSARGLRPSRIITVFGCGGDRDRFKRPLMAKAAEDASDICILTSDNPRTEDPNLIMEDARKGFTRGSHTLIVDRKEAIKAAIMNAREGDLVLVAGKGHEPYQDIQGVKHPFDDRRVARQLLDQLTRMTGEKRLERGDWRP